MTLNDFTSSLQADTDRAVDQAKRSLNLLIAECAAALEALKAAEAGQPFNHGDLDFNGQRLVEPPKDCAKAYALLTLNAHAKRIDA